MLSGYCTNDYQKQHQCPFRQEKWGWGFKTDARVQARTELLCLYTLSAQLLSLYTPPAELLCLYAQHAETVTLYTPPAERYASE